MPLYGPLKLTRTRVWVAWNQPDACRWLWVGALEGPDVAGQLRPVIARALLDRVGDPGRQADEVGGRAVQPPMT